MSNDTNRRTPAAQPAPASTGREPVAWMVGRYLFKTRPQAAQNVRNPDLAPIPLYRAVAARELDVEAERREQPSKMLDAHLRYIFELEQRIVQLEAEAKAAAPVSTEQAGDAREQVQHVTWMVGRRVGRTHALAQQIIDNLSDEAKARTSYGNIRDVLDAVHKMNRAPSPNNSPAGADSGKDQ